MRAIVELVLSFVMLGQPQQAELVCSHQVFQRDAHNEAWMIIALPEAIEADTAIRLALLDVAENTIADEEVTWPGGDARGLRFGPLGMGGPYTVELHCKGHESVRYEDLYVGDLWVLAGQSNMQGVPLPDGTGPQPEAVCTMRYGGYDWAQARQPLHVLDAEGLEQYRANFGDTLFTPVQPGFAPDAPPAWGGGVCSGVYFADALLSKTHVPIGLIPCAVGGSQLREWSPDAFHNGDPSLYTIMMRKVEAAGGHVRGMLWYQGESDALINAQNDYGERFEHFVNCVREDFDNPSLPILTVQLSRFNIDLPDMGLRWSILRQAQLDCAERLEGVDVVSMVEATHSDAIHIDIPSQARLGRNFAWLAEPWVNPELEPRRAIALDRVYFMDETFQTIAIEYKNVTGKLIADGVPTGFSVHDSVTHRDLNRIFSTHFDPEVPNRVVLRCEGYNPSFHRLAYAFGNDYYVNIHDENKMSVPGFGPLMVEIVPAQPTPEEAEEQPGQAPAVAE